MRSAFSRYFWFLTFVAGVFGGITLAAAGLLLYVLPGLPSVVELKQQPYQVPLRVFSADGVLIGEFGERRSDPLPSAAIPELIKRAVVAAEDDRFYSHPGVDYQGLMRALWVMVRTGEASQGGSTITMQVARNFFLNRERTFWRKLREVLLAFKIERELGKDEILTLYLNDHYLGNRAYGVSAAARMYYNRDVHELSLDQVATLVGLYKAPSKFNPLVNSERAQQRRDYVVRRMALLGYVTQEEAERALAMPIRTEIYSVKISTDAAYVAEMVRHQLYRQYGEEAYTRGLNVTTTVDSKLQATANTVLRKHLLDYERRYTWRGVEANVPLPRNTTSEALDRALENFPTYGGLRAGLVLSASDNSAEVYAGNTRRIKLSATDLRWTARPATRDVKSGLRAGDIVRLVGTAGDNLRLAQLPEVNGALVSLSATDGRITALVGGFDYALSPFNRVVQAERQPGSSFKPFVYSAALAKGLSPATIFKDEPFTHTDPETGKVWKPENYTGRYYGPTRMREALTHSRNLVSVRMLERIGVKYALSHIGRFKMTARPFPADLSLSLGSGVVTPLELTSGFAVFANGGYRVEPYFIARIDDHQGNLVYQHISHVVCESDCEGGKQPPASLGATSIPAERVIDDWNAFQMVSMMQDVVRTGTGDAAKALKRKDIAGKTGTTNANMDVWFSGFTRDVVTTVWIGYDQLRPLGDKETGGHLAAPTWVDYMRVALQNKPERPWKAPKGLVTVRIDSKTGLRLPDGSYGGVFETLRESRLPRIGAPSSASSSTFSEPSIYVAPARRLEVPEQIF
ncbi:MAG: penicillin-binding protein 1A [Thiotrichales bacterium]